MAQDSNPQTAVDYGKLYGESYYGSGERACDSITRYNLETIVEDKLPQAQAAMQLIHQFRVGGRLLDVGCSAGVFVKVACDAGFEAVGVDVSEVAVQFARQHLGVDARVATLESAGFDPNSFDVITLWDVLEHFEDPWRALENAGTLLASDGILALRTPNSRCLRTVLQGFRTWDMISPPEHYHLFTHKSLQLFLNRFGYEILCWRTVHSDWIYYRHARPLTKLPFLLSGAVGLGGDLVAVAQHTPRQCADDTRARVSRLPKAAVDEPEGRFLRSIKA